MQELRSSRPVAIWLMIGVGMLVVQIALGGITRLTGSGLSITEWDVVTGALPPLSHTKWLEAFDKYQQSPQFQYLNYDFTLSDFKSIYFWEWFHRLWARFMGMVFVIPFVFFLVKGYFKKWMVKPLIILFLLGALQGAVGWIMVASGLTGDAIYVAPTKLALHFVFALGLLSYTFWFSLELIVPRNQLMSAKPEKTFVITLLAILVLQLGYGALMAGHRAATAAPTWPDINGHAFPQNMFREGFYSMIGNKITVHFIHRGLAYLITVLIMLFTFRLFRVQGTPLFKKLRILPLVITLLQVILGIAAVLTSPHIVPNHWGTFEWLAQLHQLTAMCLLLSLIAILFLIRLNQTNAQHLHPR